MVDRVEPKALLSFLAVAPPLQNVASRRISDRWPDPWPRPQPYQ